MVFHFFLYDKDFEIVTDHKPLLKIMSETSDPPARIQNWMLYLQAYRFTLTHVPSEKMAADLLSRSPLKRIEEYDTQEVTIRRIVEEDIPKGYTLEQIQLKTKGDETLQKVKMAIQSNKWTKGKDMIPYFKVRKQLSCANEILLFRNQIIIPTVFKSIKVRDILK